LIKTRILGVLADCVENTLDNIDWPLYNRRKQLTFKNLHLTRHWRSALTRFCTWRPTGAKALFGTKVRRLPKK